MTKLLYSVTMSLDGFIAGPGGDMSWLTEHLGPNPMVDDLIGKIGALLVGNRTYRGDDPHKGVEARTRRPDARASSHEGLVPRYPIAAKPWCRTFRL